jgi:hypothetical protein
MGRMPFYWWRDPHSAGGGGDPPNLTPTTGKRKNKKKEKFLGGGKITKFQALTTAVKPNIGKGVEGREGQVSPRSPPWAPFPLRTRDKAPNTS